MTPQQIMQAAYDADDAWSVELRRLYGKTAGDVRYTPEGQGKQGTELNRLYLIRKAASKAHSDIWQNR